MSHVGVWKRIPGRGNGSCKNPETGAYLTYSKTGRFKEQQETWQAQGTSGGQCGWSRARQGATVEAESSEVTGLPLLGHCELWGLCPEGE